MSIDFDGAVEFFQQVIEREHEMHVAAYSERDNNRYEAIAARAQTNAAEGARLHNWRPPQPDDSWFQQGLDASRRVFAPRRLFQVKAYAHPRLGLLYRAYVSHTTRAVDNDTFYFATWFAVNEDRWKIISTYELDPDTETLDPGLSRWVHVSGVKLDDDLGLLLDVRKLEAPAEPRDLEEYNAE